MNALISESSLYASRILKPTVNVAENILAQIWSLHSHKTIIHSPFSMEATVVTDNVTTLNTNGHIRCYRCNTTVKIHGNK